MLIHMNLCLEVSFVSEFMLLRMSVERLARSTHHLHLHGECLTNKYFAQSSVSRTHANAHSRSLGLSSFGMTMNNDIKFNGAMWHVKC